MIGHHGRLQIPQVAGSGAGARPRRLLRASTEPVTRGGNAPGQARKRVPPRRRHAALRLDDAGCELLTCVTYVLAIGLVPSGGRLGTVRLEVTRGEFRTGVTHVLPGGLGTSGGRPRPVGFEYSGRELRTGVTDVLAVALVASGGRLGTVRLEVTGSELRTGVTYVLAGDRAVEDDLFDSTRATG